VSRPGGLFSFFPCIDAPPFHMINLPVLAHAKTDKPEHQQDGSGYHHPIQIFHR
jgi:hypothetical protein